MADAKAVKTSDDIMPNPHEHDPEMEGLTLYEKKALLTNRELDRHGMGRYQWSIWVLCGFGYARRAPKNARRHRRDRL
jgi:hypothetical protein